MSNYTNFDVYESFIELAYIIYCLHQTNDKTIMYCIDLSCLIKYSKHILNLFFVNNMSGPGKERSLQGLVCQWKIV